MKALDFLFYYLARWFVLTDRRKKKTIPYPDQVAYSITICLLIYLFTIDEIIEYFLFHTFDSKIPLMAFVAVAMAIYFMLRHVYIIKGRYNLILEKNDHKFGVSEKAGIIIALVVFFSSVIVMILTTLILHKII